MTLTTYYYRWGLIPSPYYYPSTSLSLTEVLTLPLGLYTTWQLGYWAVTEVLLRRKLAEDKAGWATLIGRDPANFALIG